MNPGWLTQQEGKILHRYASNASIGNVLEIGNLYGKSTEHIVNGLIHKFDRAFTLHCIDPWIYKDKDKPHPGELFWKRFYQMGVDENIVHLKAMTREVASYIMERSYGFCFVDGDHETLPTLLDILLCSTVTDTILVHDYESSTHLKVNVAVDSFLKASGWKIKETGGTIVVLKGDPTLKKAVYGDKKVPA